MNNEASAIPIPGAPPTAASANDSSQFGSYSNWARQELSKGATVQQLHQTLQQHGVNVNQPATAATGGSEPSWWQKLLPTAGGIVGGIVGLPGDLLSGGLASVGGAAAGGAAGQALENLLTHKNPLQANVLTSGAENAIGEGVGQAGTKLLGKGVSAVAGKLGNVVEGRAASEAAQTAAETTAATAKAAEAAKTAEIQRVADEFKVAPGTGDLATRSQGVVDSLSELGHTKPMASDAVAVGNTITGSNANGPGIINQEKQQILKNAGGNVNIGQIGDETTPSGKLFKQLQDYSTQAQLGDPLDPHSTTAGGSILNKYNTLANAAGVTDVGPGTVTPESGFKLLTDVSNEARTAQQMAGKPNATPADAMKAQVWSELQTNLKDSLYNRPEVNEAVSDYKVSPEVEGQIDAKIKAEGITDPKVAGNLKQKLLDTLNNGQSMQDWLSHERTGVDMHKVGNSALKQQGNVAAASTQRLAKGELANEAITKGEPDLAPASKGGNKLLDMAAMGAAPLTHGMSLIGLTPHLLNMAKDPGVQAGAYKALSKATSSKVAKKMIPNLIRGGAIASANLPNMAAESTGGGAIPMAPAAQMTGGAMQPGQAGPQQMNPLTGTYSTLLAQEQAAPTVLGPSLSPVLQALAPAAQKQELAGTSLAGLPSAYAGAGGEQGMMGGLLDQIIARIAPGSAQSTYARQSSATAAQLAAILGITPQQAMALLPTQTQTPGSAIPSLGNVQNLSAGLGVPTQ